MPYDKMSHDVLKQVAEGNGHCYRHEAKAMARELIEFRAERAAGTKPSPSPSPSQIPFPWGTTPP